MFLFQNIFRKGIKRTQNKVKSEYGEEWSRPVEIRYAPKLRMEKLGDRIIYCGHLDHRKFFLDHLSEEINKFQPKNILELGSGDGINLLALALKHESLESLTGIELTENGVEISKKLLADPPVKILSLLTKIKEGNIKKTIKTRRIEFVKGDILNMPFKPKSFGFAFSMWVLEQLPENYLTFFKETEKILNGQAVFFEAFKEAQENIFQLMHLKNLDYFRSSFHEAEKAGLQILKFEPMELSKIKFRNGALLVQSKN